MDDDNAKVELEDVLREIDSIKDTPYLFLNMKMYYVAMFLLAYVSEQLEELRNGNNRSNLPEM